MRLRLSSGFRVAISPFLPWESRPAPSLRISCGGVFCPAHVTTRLCLELIDECMRAAPFNTVLDVGCGSGILGLAAVRMGASLAVGLDIDRRAVAVSRQNAQRNGLGARTAWLAATVAAVRGPFDGVLANLPFAVLTELLPDLISLLPHGGTLITSGFQDIECQHITTMLESRGMAVQQMRSGDFSFYGTPPSGSFTWMALKAQKNR